MFVANPFLEEPGFALPRFQERSGPSVGSLMISLLWAVWHLPFYFLPGWASENGRLSLASIAVFGMSGIATAIIRLTWVFNHTHGSLLMVILVHASINQFQNHGDQLFPTQADSILAPMIGFAALAILIVTRNQLGYTAYQREQERSTLGSQFSLSQPIKDL